MPEPLRIVHGNVERVVRRDEAEEENCGDPGPALRSAEPANDYRDVRGDHKEAQERNQPPGHDVVADDPTESANDIERYGRIVVAGQPTVRGV